jgi:hypothetical protein
MSNQPDHAPIFSRKNTFFTKFFLRRFLPVYWTLASLGEILYIFLDNVPVFRDCWLQSTMLLGSVNGGFWDASFLVSSLMSSLFLMEFSTPSFANFLKRLVLFDSAGRLLFDDFFLNGLFLIDFFFGDFLGRFFPPLL